MYIVYTYTYPSNFLNTFEHSSIYIYIYIYTYVSVTITIHAVRKYSQSQTVLQYICRDHNAYEVISVAPS